MRPWPEREGSEREGSEPLYFTPCMSFWNGLLSKMTRTPRPKMA